MKNASTSSHGHVHVTCVQISLVDSYQFKVDHTREERMTIQGVIFGCRIPLPPSPESRNHTPKNPPPFPRRAALSPKLSIHCQAEAASGTTQEGVPTVPIARWGQDKHSRRVT